MPCLFIGSGMRPLPLGSPHLPRKWPTLALPVRDPEPARHRGPSPGHCSGVWRNACPLLLGDSEFPTLLCAPVSPGAAWAPRGWVDRVGAALHTWPKLVGPGGPSGAQASGSRRACHPCPGLARTQLPAVCEPQPGEGVPILQNYRGSVSVRPHGGG